MTVTRTWYLELNSVPLATYAWEIPDLSGMLDSPTLRGVDRILPYVDGAIPYPRRPTVTVVTFPLDVVGLCDEDGEEADDVFEQLNTNMDYLHAQLEAGWGVGDGTIPAEFHRGDLDSWTGDVHFLGFKGTRTMGAAMLRTTFDISIPAGSLVSTGS